QGIRADRRPDRPRPMRPAKARGDIRVRASLAVGNAAQLAPYSQLKIRAAHVHWQGELFALAAEILHELGEEWPKPLVVLLEPAFQAPRLDPVREIFLSAQVAKPLGCGSCGKAPLLVRPARPVD